MGRGRKAARPRLFRHPLDMKDKHFNIFIAILCVVLLAAIAGVVWLAGYLGRRYGIVAGMMTIILPISACTTVLLIMLIRESKGSK